MCELINLRLSEACPPVLPSPLPIPPPRGLLPHPGLCFPLQQPRFTTRGQSLLKGEAVSPVIMEPKARRLLSSVRGELFIYIYIFFFHQTILERKW